MGFYDIDWNKTVREYVPVEDRWPRRLAWLRLLVWGVRMIWQSFMTYRADRMYLLTHNSQVCFMEGALNDTFDNGPRRIYIDDGPYLTPIWLYLDEEESPVWLCLDSELPDPVGDYDAPVWLHTDVEMVYGWQFIVYYPTGLVFDMARMRALIERYRLPSKNVYSIQAY